MAKNPAFSIPQSRFSYWAGNQPMHWRLHNPAHSQYWSQGWIKNNRSVAWGRSFGVKNPCQIKYADQMICCIDPEPEEPKEEQETFELEIFH